MPDGSGFQLTEFQVNHEEYKKVIETNENMFISTCYPELDLTIPEFHPFSFKWMISSEVSRIAIALPRGHAKTMLSRAAVVWYFCYTDFQFCLYLSNTAQIAIDSVKVIKEILESDNIRNLFGPCEWKVEKDGDGYYEFYFNGMLRIIKAVGAGKQVRGTNIHKLRPQLLVVDDLEDNETSCSTKEQQDKLNRWVYGPLFKAMDRRKKKIIWNGNMISTTCLLKKFCENADWTSIRLGAILSNGEPLWNDMWPIEALREDFKEYVALGLASIWYAEMMNMPISEGNGIIRGDQIGYAVSRTPGDLDYGFITIDPAISDKSWANSCAFAIHGFVDGKWQIVETEKRKGMDALAIFWHAINLAWKWKINTIGVESGAFQAVLQTLFKYMMLENNIENINIVPLKSGNTQKTMRIVGWCGLLIGGSYVLTEGDYEVTEELLNYNPLAKDNVDDLIDACAYGVQMQENYMYLILQTISVMTAKVVRSIDRCAI